MGLFLTVFILKTSYLLELVLKTLWLLLGPVIEAKSDVGQWCKAIDRPVGPFRSINACVSSHFYNALIPLLTIHNV